MVTPWESKVRTALQISSCSGREGGREGREGGEKGTEGGREVGCGMLSYIANTVICCPIAYVSSYIHKQGIGIILT